MTNIAADRLDAIEVRAADASVAGVEVVELAPADVLALITEVREQRLALHRVDMAAEVQSHPASVPAQGVTRDRERIEHIGQASAALKSLFDALGDRYRLLRRPDGTYAPAAPITTKLGDRGRLYCPFTGEAFQMIKRRFVEKMGLFPEEVRVMFGDPNLPLSPLDLR